MMTSVNLYNNAISPRKKLTWIQLRFTNVNISVTWESFFHFWPNRALIQWNNKQWTVWWCFWIGAYMQYTCERMNESEFVWESKSLFVWESESTNNEDLNSIKKNLLSLKSAEWVQALILWLRVKVVTRRGEHSLFFLCIQHLFCTCIHCYSALHKFDRKHWYRLTELL